MKTRKKGFTLVELIVVLVILAILIAFLVPALTGYIEKSKQKSAMVECRQCVNAAQTIGSHAYGEDKALAFDTITKAEIEKLGEVDGIVSEATWDDSAKVSKLVYTSKGDITVIYENGKYTIGTKSASGKDIIEKLKDVLNEEGLLGQSMDSGAVDSTSSNAYKLSKALESSGFSLSGLNATSWKYAPGGQPGPFFYWTPVDIKNLSVGEKIPVMKYSIGSGNYTVWYATIGTDNGGGMAVPYNVLKIGSAYSPSTKEQNQTYDNMLKYYKDACDGK